jgi:uracil-DNA glycosylase family 4
MFSIKSSFANCSVCELLQAPSCILETNCEDDLSKVDVVFVAENPGKEEVIKGIPLIGPAGQIFREPFKKYGLDKTNYLLINTVLCQTLKEDGKSTGNPTDDMVDRSKINCMNIIKMCNPKLIVLMGGTAMRAFGISKKTDGITKRVGHTYEWEGFKVYLTFHPSYFQGGRGGEAYKDRFLFHISNVARYMNGEDMLPDPDSKNVETLGKGIFRYKIPEHFYTDQYRLIDIQYLQKTNEILYIFRDKDNKKIFHKESDEYVAYQAENQEVAKKIVPYDNLKQVKLKFKDKIILDPTITYEGDMKLTVKHALDYYFHNKGDCKRTSMNIMYADIEIDTGKERVFPSPTLAKFPINLISTRYNGKNITYILDNKTEPIEPIEGIEFKIFSSEKSMLQQFIKDFKDSQPDYIAGWNLISFDLTYIFNRMANIKIPNTTFTEFNEFFVDGDRFICNIPGCVPIDQYFLYRSFTFTKLENYKLGFVAQLEVKETKRDLPLPFNEMYWKLLNKTIDYNIQDTALLEKLENKLGHINLLAEIARVCNASLDAGGGSFGQIDTLMVSFLRNRGYASKNSDMSGKEKYPGAFVFTPTAGIYNWITDFDFASLYPSLMITYNIGITSFVMKLKDPHLAYEFIYDRANLPEVIDIIDDPLHNKKTTTVTTEQLIKQVEEEKLVYTINGCFFKPHKKQFSEFAQVVTELMNARKDYKTKMFEAIGKKDKDAENFYNTRQLVYKVLANTLYGVVANQAFRFFDLSLASAITMSGQEALKTSIIEADALMRSMENNSPYKPPKPLTKKEMYADPDLEPEIYMFPDRSRDYIVTGDTDSIFCCFDKISKEKTIEEIAGYCKIVETFLNDNKIKELVLKHNGDQDFNRLALKNELTISRGIFLAKKRYAIRVVGQEGKAVDKMNYMGVEIKRSDYPSKSKAFLKDLLDLVLKAEKVSLPKLMKFVKSKEGEFIDLINKGDKTISRPVSYTKEESEYKSIPQGVRAMETWNKLEYDIHKPGAKAYMFLVKGIDTEKAPEHVIKSYSRFIKDGNKLEVIAIPDDEARLPEYYIVDSKKMLEFSFKDRYNLMLQPLLDAKKSMETLTF